MGDDGETEREGGDRERGREGGRGRQTDRVREKENACNNIGYCFDIFNLICIVTNDKNEQTFE